MKCDIIIPVWNELEITKNCISSILKNTKFPYRLIIIDNASSPDMHNYFESLRKEFVDLMLIRNKKNLGYVKAVNQGFKQSRAEFVCLLNNDTVVCNGWLGEMINIANDNIDIAIVNPSSNTLAQSLPKGQTIECFAGSLKVFKGQWAEVGQCSGFCMLIKRRVIEKIGFFDEVYKVGYFEEIDYCRRTQKAGFRFARAKASYVYHIDQQSFKKITDKEKIFSKNRQIFESRWGKQLRIACIISKPPKDQIDKDEIEEIMLTSARDNHWVSVCIRKKLIPKFDIAEHSNILIFKFNNIFFPIICLFKIITKKQKKRFNLILVDGVILFHILKFFSFIHKARLMFNPHLERAIELSHKEARK